MRCSSAPKAPWRPWSAPTTACLLKKLTIGRDFGNSVEVLDGITATDAVVINPPDSLEQGEKVDISTSKKQ